MQLAVEHGILSSLNKTGAFGPWVVILTDSWGTGPKTTDIGQFAFFPEGVKMVDSGTYHNLIVKNDGSLWAMD